MREKVVVFGSTGTVGTQSVDVLLRMKDRFETVAIAGFSNLPLLAEQAVRLNCRTVLTAKEGAGKELKKLLPAGFTVREGMDALCEQAERPDADKILFSISGMPAFRPFLAAVRAGKKIALATKEVIVSAGNMVNRELEKHHSVILPVDSEHSAVFQCLRCGGEVKRLILTCSGGAFRDFSLKQMETITPEEALNHPVWNMGKKITIDSASLMNKTLEVIEAHHLFRIPGEKISVLIHPQAVIHSMVEFADGSILSQMGPPDMRYPIQYALTCPERINTELPRLDFTKIASMTFREPDTERFPALLFAQEVIRKGDGAGTVLNAANDIAVRRFLNHEIGFRGMAKLVRLVMDSMPDTVCNTEDEVLAADHEARKRAETIKPEALF